MWFDGLEDRVDSTRALLSDASIGQDGRQRFVDFEIDFVATEEQLRTYALNLQDVPGHWSKSKAQLGLAKKLFENDKLIEGKVALLEVVQVFEQKQLPTHPIVMSALIVADQFQISELDVGEWWASHQGQVELDHPTALEVFAAVAKWRDDPKRECETIKPWLTKLAPIANVFLKPAAMRDV